MPSVAETVTELTQWVFPEHAGAPGQIHGGRMMEWITQVGTSAAARVARGTVALGSLDDLDFLHPVRVGEIAILRAQVEYVGRSSLEVGVRVWSENVATGERAVTLNSHLVFVKVGVDGRPQPVADKIAPRDRAERDLIEAARQRREARLARFAKKVERAGEVDDKVLAEVPWTGEVRHACTAYLTFVHLGPDRRPRPCPPFTPATPGERRRWEAALGRREARLARVKRLRASLAGDAQGPEAPVAEG